MSKANYKVLFGAVLLLLSFINNAQAFKLHLVLACDQDANIGNSVMVDYQNMKDLFSNFFGPSLDLVPLSTHNLTADSIYNAIDSMEVESSDTVLFYYSGHGSYDYQNGTQLLTLENGPSVKRNELLKKLRGKDANLLILLTDCCNVIPEPINEDDDVIVRPGPGMKKLFMKTSGELDITSSRIAEFSLGDPKLGGYFTICFLKFLRDNAYNENVEWSDLQKKVQPELTKMFQGFLDNDGDPSITTGSDGKKYIDFKKQGVYALPGMPEKQFDQRMYIYACPGMPIRFGAGVRFENSQLVVKKVLSNTPAEKVGIEVGDCLLEINNSPLKTYGDYDILINYSPQQMRLKIQKQNGDVKNLIVPLAYE